jgi:hypothetical protein
MTKMHSEEELNNTFKLLGIDSEEKRKEIIKVQSINELVDEKPSQFFIRIDTTSKIYGEEEDA